MEGGGGSIRGSGTSNSNTKSCSSSGLKVKDLKMKQPSSSDLKNKEKGNKNGSGSNKSSTATDDKECLVREHDLLLPIANVIRIMRKVLPPHAKISDESKVTVQACVSEFIMFVSGEANDKCKAKQRKTLTAEDVLWAIGKLGLDHYVEPLGLFLRRYRETEFDRTPVGEFLFKMPPAATDFGSQSDLSQGPGPAETAPYQVDLDVDWFLEEAAMADYIIDAEASGQAGGQYE